MNHTEYSLLVRVHWYSLVFIGCLCHHTIIKLESPNFLLEIMECWVLLTVLPRKLLRHIVVHLWQRSLANDGKRM